MEIRDDILTEDILSYYNNTYLMQKYDQINNSEEQYALIQLNIKNFRYFNTKYGCKGGDEILLLTFRQLMSILTEEEYGAHIYADNFAVLLKYKDINTLVYERMMQLIDKMYRIEDERIYRELFISIGIYQILDSGVTFGDALNYANLCRKECDTLFNRSHCMEIYDKNFYDCYIDRLQLEADTANAYKNYEFITYLQPKINLTNDQIAGAEALLRWFDKEGNSIPLYKFLPILNQNAYIGLIDLDTFDQMCQYLDSRIKNNQKVVPISFNVSKSHFYDPNIITDYIQIFEKYNIPKNLIEIELMESISMDDTERMKQVISGFKDYGFTCSLDDFGNGYSSFNVLLNAELDYIKMDRQFFVNNLNGDAELIIKTVVNLVHSLKMKVVAEGVETERHIEYLKACGCDYVQGYYYYKPIPIEEFNSLLDAQEDN